MDLNHLGILFLSLVIQAGCYKRVCYYTNWSQNRPAGGRFTPANIDPYLCTHIIFAFAKIDGHQLGPFEKNDEPTEWTTGLYEQVTSMKEINPDLKVILAVGGWNTGSLIFLNVVTNDKSRGKFIQSTIRYLRMRNFDGLDIDWEYPARRRGRPMAETNLTVLLSDMRAAFQQEAQTTGSAQLLLTAAVPTSKQFIQSGYDVAQVTRLLDFINVMTYDFHGSWASKTGHNSPLFKRSSEIGDDAVLNVEAAIDNWLKLGATKDKLVVGIPTYGRSFTLMHENQTDMGAPDVEHGPAGYYTKENGFMAYYEVCELINDGAATFWHSEHKVPYLVNGTTWVGYDDKNSIKEKVAWIKDRQLAGAVVWSLDLDDFGGEFCNEGMYPLITAIKTEFESTTPEQAMPLSATRDLKAIDSNVIAEPSGTVKGSAASVTDTEAAGIFTNPDDPTVAIKTNPADLVGSTGTLSAVGNLILTASGGGIVGSDTGSRQKQLDIAASVEGSRIDGNKHWKIESKKTEDQTTTSNVGGEPFTDFNTPSNAHAAHVHGTWENNVDVGVAERTSNSNTMSTHGSNKQDHSMVSETVNTHVTGLDATAPIIADIMETAQPNTKSGSPGTETVNAHVTGTDANEQISADFMSLNKLSLSQLGKTDAGVAEIASNINTMTTHRRNKQDQFTAPRGTILTKSNDVSHIKIGAEGAVEKDGSDTKLETQVGKQDVTHILGIPDPLPNASRLTEVKTDIFAKDKYTDTIPHSSTVHTIETSKIGTDSTSNVQSIRTNSATAIVKNSNIILNKNEHVTKHTGVISTHSGTPKTDMDRQFLETSHSRKTVYMPISVDLEQQKLQHSQQSVKLPTHHRVPEMSSVPNRYSVLDSGLAKDTRTEVATQNINDLDAGASLQRVMVMGQLRDTKPLKGNQRMTSSKLVSTENAFTGNSPTYVSSDSTMQSSQINIAGLSRETRPNEAKATHSVRAQNTDAVDIPVTNPDVTYAAIVDQTVRGTAKQINVLRSSTDNANVILNQADPVSMKNSHRRFATSGMQTDKQKTSTFSTVTADVLGDIISPSMFESRTGLSASPILADRSRFGNNQNSDTFAFDSTNSLYSGDLTSTDRARLLNFITDEDRRIAKTSPYNSKFQSQSSVKGNGDITNNNRFPLANTLEGSHVTTLPLKNNMLSKEKTTRDILSILSMVSKNSVNATDTGGKADSRYTAAFNTRKSSNVDPLHRSLEHGPQGPDPTRYKCKIWNVICLDHIFDMFFHASDWHITGEWHRPRNWLPRRWSRLGAWLRWNRQRQLANDNTRSDNTG